MGGGAIGGSGGVKIALILAVVMNFGGYWFSDKLALSMSGAQEVSPEQVPELYRIVSGLAQRAGIPMPRLYVIPDATPNAFATGRNPQHAAVAVTHGILGILSWDELEGVLAHELGHVLNRDILIGSVAAMLAGALTSLAHMAMFFGGSYGNDDRENSFGPIGTLLLMILAPLAATLIQLAISRSREYEADRTGAQLCGHPMSLAHALQKLEMGNEERPMVMASPATAHMFIVNPLRGSGLANLFSTHPPIAARIERLQAMSSSVVA